MMEIGINKVWTAILLVGTALPQVQGTVTGTVVDETGKPIVKAKVHIAEKDVVVAHRILQFQETDDKGHFRIAHVSWGTYVVMAGKEEAGYPDTALAFYSNLAVPTVTLAPEFPNAVVNVELGPKAGTLQLDPIVDALTGKEIRSATITLRRINNKEFFVTASTSEGHIPVPSLSEVTIEIGAKGYKQWPSEDQANSVGKLFLQPGQIVKLRVSLQPEQPVAESANN